MWHQSTDEVTAYFYLVEDYFNKRMLAKLGYTFSGDHLSDFEVEAYTVIANQAAKLELEEMKRNTGK